MIEKFNDEPTMADVLNKIEEIIDAINELKEKE